MDQRNLVLAIVLSLAILVGFQYFFVPPTVPEGAPQTEATNGQAPLSPPGVSAPGAPSPAAPTPGTSSAGGPRIPTLQADSSGEVAMANAGATREQALARSARIRIETPTLRGSISLSGGRIDDLTLTRYREGLSKESPNIVLLSPTGSKKPYFANFGWITANHDIAVPSSNADWKADGDVLSPDRPVTLTWDNGQGLRFERKYAIDDNYMFTVTQRVINSSADAVTLAPYGLVSRSGTPDILGFYILHEGLLGVFNGTLSEIDYKDLREDGPVADKTTGGWLGITDKYWLVALVPNQKKPVDTRFMYHLSGNTDTYQADYLYDSVAIQPGATTEVTSELFAGAKVVSLLDGYRDNQGIDRFDLAIDFGWFYFLTKPLFYALHFFAQTIGNFGVAILLLTVCVKLVFFPLANKSYRAMAKMRNLQPQMLKLRERFPDDKQRLNQEMMALYKKEGANPMSGCLPIVVQIPVFFSLYKVMFVTIEMRHAPFFGWIQDLSAPDPTSILNLFGLLPWETTGLGPLHILNLGIWPLAMGLTMFLQQRLNPQPADPVQAKLFMFMPIIFTFLLASFPAGLVVYWTWNNLLSIAQQYVIMKRAGVAIGGKAKNT